MFCSGSSISRSALAGSPLCPRPILSTSSDDTNERSGVKFSVFDLIGLPYQVIIGPRLAVDNNIEIKDRRTSERFTLNKDEACNFIRELLNKTKV